MVTTTNMRLQPDTIRLATPDYFISDIRLDINHLGGTDVDKSWNSLLKIGLDTLTSKQLYELLEVFASKDVYQSKAIEVRKALEKKLESEKTTESAASNNTTTDDHSST